MSQRVGGDMNEHGWVPKRRRRGRSGNGRFGRREGQCVSWHANNGWGFVRDDATGVAYFCHHSAIRPQLFPKLGEPWYKNVLYTGEHVSYCLRTNPQDRSKLMCDEVTGPNGKTLLMDHAVMKVMEYRRYAATPNPAVCESENVAQVGSECAPPTTNECAPPTTNECAPPTTNECVAGNEETE